MTDWLSEKVPPGVNVPDDEMRMFGAEDQIREEAESWAERRLPKPYYEEPESGIVIYHADCRDILPLLPKVDLVLVTDPPYGISYDASHDKYKNGISREEAEWDKQPFDPAHLIALGLPSIIWGGNCFSSKLPDHPGWLCWVKTVRDGAEIRQADMEMAWTNCIRRPQTIRHLWIGAYRDSESGKQNFHPTQKPERVMRWCISLLPGAAAILDPYMGSGTTLVAAKQLGRRAIGIEIEEKYCAIAVERLRQAVLPLEPAAPEPEQLPLESE
ncbi:MAG: DNA methyltransferase [Planctomycetota bacterium]